MASNELDTPFANIARLLDLATDMAICDPKRISYEGCEGYFTPYEQSETLASLLVVTRDYAARKLAEYDEVQKASRSGGAS